MAIGCSGVGKSKFGCEFLRNNEAFIVSNSPDPTTLKINSSNTMINGLSVNFIDTPAICASDDFDYIFNKQTKQFLKSWKLGINMFYVILNAQNPRFDKSIEEIFRKINGFINDKKNWNNVAIIFTRCINGYYDKRMFIEQYRRKIIDFVKSIDGNENLEIQLPCFFIGSDEWQNDRETNNELLRILAFSQTKNQVSVNNLNVDSLYPFIINK